MTTLDTAFAGSIPEVYDTHLVPLIFDSYAADIVRRLATRPVSRVLEIAAGTGVVTRALAANLAPSVPIVATDLNPAMLDRAAKVGTARPVEWRQADAMQLPFPDGSFDTIVCQFGVMFFPDKARAFAEARRVLQSGGTLVFNVWDRLSDNDFASTVAAAVESVFPADPPRFLQRLPYAYNDVAVIRRDLVAGGFAEGTPITTVEARSRAASPRIPALAYCQGTPLRNEIEARDPARLAEATDVAAAAIARRFGSGAVDGKIQALVAVAHG